MIHRSSKLLTYFGLAVIFLFTAGEAAAQSVASVTGRVVDESGAPVGGAQIVATDQQTGRQLGVVRGPLMAILSLRTTAASRSRVCVPVRPTASRLA